MRLRVLPLLATLSLAALAGCAVASEDVDGVAPSRKPDGGGGGDTSEEEEDTGESTETDTGTSSTGDDTGGATEDTGSSSTDSGATKDTGAPPTDSGGPGACSTLTATDCMGASSLGSVSGDTGSGIKTATGTDSKFLRVTVTEDDSAVFSSKDPKARITLKSTGGNFDLYVYQGPTKDDGGGVECSTFKVSSTEPASDDVVSISWNDNRPIGGHDDARVLTLEVRATMPSCAGASWSLTVEGNK